MFIYALCIFPKLDPRSGDGVLQGPIISPPDNLIFVLQEAL